MTTNVLVLAAGQSGGLDSNYPICLAELDGVSIIERIVNNTKTIDDVQYTFALAGVDIDCFYLDKVVKLLNPDAKIAIIPDRTRGSACTALLAACQQAQDNDLLIVSANELVDLDLSIVVNDFQKRRLDGGTLTFRSIHPRYSYVRLREDGYVCEVAQQKPISQNATAGIFWFKKTAEFVDAVKCVIRKNALVAGKFFVAVTFNELILKQKKIGTYSLETNKYKPLKTERQIELFEQGPSA